MWQEERERGECVEWKRGRRRESWRKVVTVKRTCTPRVHEFMHALSVCVCASPSCMPFEQTMQRKRVKERKAGSITISQSLRRVKDWDREANRH